MWRFWSCHLILILFSFSVLASLPLPSQLGPQDRQKALEILGPSTAHKVLGNPYPLGGFSGFEIGYTLEVIPTSELSTLGGKTRTQSETAYSNLAFAKGLYKNIDLFLNFTPLTQTEDFSNVGGGIRWSFYESEFLPAQASFILHGNHLNIQNLITASNQGLDLVVGFAVNDLTLYAGAGYLTSYGKFLGGESSLNSEGSSVTEGSVSIWRGETITQSISTTHYLVGANIRYEKFFLAAEMDRYFETVFSAKLGYRF